MPAKTSTQTVASGFSNLCHNVQATASISSHHCHWENAEKSSTPCHNCKHQKESKYITRQTTVGRSTNN